MDKFCRAVLLLAVGWSAGGCIDKSDSGRTAPVAAELAPPTNRIDIPGPVRSNLGITFARVERRAIANILRVPGRFELLPTARVEFHAPLRGRVELAVQQLQSVRVGDLLYRLDSPDWRDLQRELSDTLAAIDIAQAQLQALGPIREAHRRHELGLQENIALWTARKETLENLGGVVGNQAQQMAEAQSKITDSSSALGELMEKDAELELRRVETESRLRSARSKQDLLLTSAAALVGIPKEQLLEAIPPSNPEAATESVPRWRLIAVIEIRATIAGVVESLAATQGTWTEEGALVMSVADPSQLRFRAQGPQSDLDQLRTGLPAAIVNPALKGARANEAIPTTLALGLYADPQERTLELFAIPSEHKDWTRVGVAAYLEIETEQTAEATLAIPLSAVGRDGLTAVVFRRDPNHPDQALRIAADLGMNDGRWVAIHSGVREGDEVVLDGVYQLLLATAGSRPKGGHFHADGTYHEGTDDH